MSLAVSNPTARLLPFAQARIREATRPLRKDLVVGVGNHLSFGAILLTYAAKLLGDKVLTILNLPINIVDKASYGISFDKFFNSLGRNKDLHLGLAEALYLGREVLSKSSGTGSRVYTSRFYINGEGGIGARDRSSVDGKVESVEGKVFLNKLLDGIDEEYLQVGIFSKFKVANLKQELKGLKTNREMVKFLDSIIEEYAFLTNLHGGPNKLNTPSKALPTARNAVNLNLSRVEKSLTEKILLCHKLHSAPSLDSGNGGADVKRGMLGIVRKLDRGGNDPRRMEREIRNLERLKEVAGVVKIRGQIENGFEMDRVAGVSLEALIDGKFLSTEESLLIALRLANVLKNVHAKLVAHLDLKPANILVRSDGSVVLIDFGIGRLYGEKPLNEGSIEGTISYIAPEIVEGESKNPLKADVFAFGLIMEEMVTGSLCGDEDKTVAQLIMGRLTKRFEYKYAPIFRDDRYVPLLSLLEDMYNLDEKERVHMGDVTERLESFYNRIVTTEKLPGYWHAGLVKEGGSFPAMKTSPRSNSC